MSLPRFNILVLSLSIGIASVMVGCSSNPKKVTDTGPKSSEQVYYDKAQQSLAKGQLVEAAKQLEALDTYYPTGQYTQQAQLDLMYTRLKQKDYPAAIALADRFIRVYPQHAQLDYAYYLRGVANMEQNYDSLLRYTSLQQAHRDVGYIKVAYQNFDEFIRRFPSSKYAVDAAQRMQFISNELAEHEMNVARFNIERKAWVSAIQRARWVLEYYPKSPQIAEAIATIAHAYGKLGDTASADQYKKLLQTNYPQLIKANGEVNLRAARNEGSLLNQFSLGILGRSAQTAVTDKDTPIVEERSLLNRVSMGLLDENDASQQPIAQPEPEPKNQRSLLNRISLGLLDKADQTAPTSAE